MMNMSDYRWLYPIDISKETPQSRKPRQCICKILQMHRAHYPAVIFLYSYIIGFGFTLF